MIKICMLIRPTKKKAKLGLGIVQLIIMGNLL